MGHAGLHNNSTLANVGTQKNRRRKKEVMTNTADGLQPIEELKERQQRRGPQ